MRRNSTSSMGAIHPVIFFTLVYGISLMMAIFVCRTVYHAIHASDSSATVTPPVEQSGSQAIAYN
jgi:hypothetical protein